MSYNAGGLNDLLSAVTTNLGSEEQPPPLQVPLPMPVPGGQGLVTPYQFGVPAGAPNAYGAIPAAAPLPVVPQQRQEGDGDDKDVQRLWEKVVAGHEENPAGRDPEQGSGAAKAKDGGGDTENKESEPKQQGEGKALASAKETPPEESKADAPVKTDEQSGQVEDDDMDQDDDDEQEISMDGTRRRRTFDENVEALNNFKTQFGHCNVKKGYKGDPILARWVSMVRWRRARLTQEQREKLDNLGFDWESRQQKMDRVWESMFEKLRAYKEEHGNTRVPKRYRDDQTLAKWVDYQRQQHSIGKMTQERIKKLDTLDFTFRFKEGEKKASAADEAKWNVQFNRLVEYKKKHGHCLVPKSGPQAVDETFWRWVQRQRHNYAHFGRLPGDRKERLEDIGYNFGDVKSQSISVRTQSQWDHMFNKVKAYKESHGTIRITGKENARLRQWLTCQMAEGRKGNVNPTRVKRLHELGAIFCVDDDNGWEEYFQKLKAGKIDNVNYEEDMAILDEKSGNLADLLMADWIRRQRWLKARGYLHPDRRKKLNHTGFTWKSDNTSTISEVYAKRSKDHWRDMFQKLEAFQAEHGHVNVPKEEKSLSNWLNKQLRNGRLGTLEAEYADRLKSLGLTWCEDDDEGFQTNMERLKREMENDPKLEVAGTDMDNLENDEDKAFVEWIKRQRTLYKLKKLDPNREAQLDEIDFDWKIMRETKKSPKRKRKNDDNDSDNDEESDKKKQKRKPPAKKKAKATTTKKPAKTSPPKSTSTVKQMPASSDDADDAEQKGKDPAGSSSREKQESSAKDESKHETADGKKDEITMEDENSGVFPAKEDDSNGEDVQKKDGKEPAKEPEKGGGKLPVGTRVRRKIKQGWSEGKVVEHRGKHAHVKYDGGDFSEDLSDEELDVAAFAYTKRHKRKKGKSE